MPNESNQPAIFLSYAHEDRLKAQNLAAALSARGYTLWWDELIEGGAQFARSIRDALEAADAVVVLWSAKSVESDWVQDEAAQGRDRKRLVPLSLDGTFPPLGFRQYQTIDLSGTRGKPSAAKLRAIDRAIRIAIGDEGHAPPAATVLAPPTSRRGVLAMVAGAASVAGIGAVAWRTRLIGGGAAAGDSIAVLPFKNVGGDPLQAYLSDGLTEEVRSALTRNPALRVLAATSSATSRDHDEDAVATASRLGVAYLLDGSVQRAGDMVRIAATLTNGRTGFAEWSQSAERKLTDIFALQSEIAATVAGAMSVRSAVAAPIVGGTRNAAAYENYLRGKSLYNLAKDEQTDFEARARFEAAIAADPKFALAHAGLSRTLSSIAAEDADASQLKPLYAAAIAEAQAAVRIAPGLPEGQLALGFAQFSGRLDIRGAKPAYDLAYRYGRGNADILLLVALYMVRARRFGEAQGAIDRSLGLDPLNPRTHRAAGSIAFARRRYDDSVAQYAQALQLNPKITNAHAQRGFALLMLGRNDLARADFVAEPKRMFGDAGLAILEHRLSHQPAAEQALARLIREFGDSALYQQVQVMAQWGRSADALKLLQRARAVGDSGLTALTTDPLLDPIVRDPGYVRLVRDLGFA